MGTVLTCSCTTYNSCQAAVSPGQERPENNLLMVHHVPCRQMVSRPVFADAFWQCYNTLKATATPEAGMPGYFRFLTLLSESHNSISTHGV